MVRKQLYIKPAQAELLKEQAATYNVSEGALVRMALDQHLAAPIPGESFFDLSAWETVKKFINQRAKLFESDKGISEAPVHKGRVWKREDLYDR